MTAGIDTTGSKQLITAGAAGSKSGSGKKRGRKHREGDQAGALA